MTIGWQDSLARARPIDQGTGSRSQILVARLVVLARAVPEMILMDMTDVPEYAVDVASIPLTPR